LRRSFFRRNKIRDLAVTHMPYPPTTLIDIGCGRGRAVAELAKELIEAGYQPIPLGIEISSELARTARSKLEKLMGRCLNTDALSGLKQVPDGIASLVLMSAYLEHECQPLEVLRNAARCLQTGGVVVIKVPNFASWNRRIMGPRWCGFRYPDHVNYFTPQNLFRIAQKAGLKVRRHGWTDAFPTSDNMYFVLEKP
jgi:ubiquinone/menaquinone biosynthesis C-methylase UbiE